MKVIVLGGTGFVGQNVCDVLKENNIETYIFSKSTKFNLLFIKAYDFHDKIFKNADYIINCAADVGSLNYVTDKAADVFYNNSKMILNLYDYLVKIQTKATVINPIANCGFPGELSLYKEFDFWQGELHPSVLSYGSTRRFN